VLSYSSGWRRCDESAVTGLGAFLTFFSPSASIIIFCFWRSPLIARSHRNGCFTRSFAHSLSLSLSLLGPLCPAAPHLTPPRLVYHRVVTSSSYVSMASDALFPRSTFVGGFSFVMRARNYETIPPRNILSGLSSAETIARSCELSPIGDNCKMHKPRKAISITKDYLSLIGR
jgi:hypothetical protein